MYRLLENIPIPCLHGPFSGRDIKANSKQWWEFLARYLNPANLLNLQPEIVDWLLNAYPTDLPRTMYSVDEIERWALVDIKPKRLLDTTCNKPVTYTRLYTASSVFYWQCRCHRQQARDLSIQRDACNPTQGRLWAMNDCPTYHLCIYTAICKSTWI